MFRVRFFSEVSILSFSYEALGDSMFASGLSGEMRNMSITDELQPYLFAPVYKDYLWGGERIIKKFKRKAPKGIYAESWEVSDRDEGMSIVENGTCKGASLHELVTDLGDDLLGTACHDFDFPLLVKLIDAKDRLSVQVHPNDSTSLQFGGEPKTEMWYILEAAKGAHVYAGLKKGVDAEVFNEALREKKFGDVLTRIPVKAGDAVFMPGGRVHAIDAGCLILEVQQNSNTTYRIYDWERLDAEGRVRPLHLNEALRVIDFKDDGEAKLPVCKPVKENGSVITQILQCDYFLLDKIELAKSWPLGRKGETFEIIFVTSGVMKVKWGKKMSLDVSTGRSVLIPAALEGVTMEPAKGKAEVLRIRLPEDF